MQKVKLAEALLRRKELAMKCGQLHQVRQQDILEVVIKRININDSTDEVKATVPRVTMAELTQEFDYYAGALRRVDAAIQQANWATEIEVEENTMRNYVPPPAKD